MAARIDFEPLKAVPVALPGDAAFVVSNTLEARPWGGGGRGGRRRRVRGAWGETRLLREGTGHVVSKAEACLVRRPVACGRL